MSSMLNRSRFGAHGDVMGASPTDEAGKTTLCEEIKSRARAEFARKNFPQAEMLYTKAVEIKPDDATLHSNLAAVRLGLNKAEPALENAMEALRLDPKYTKGLYRKGQALMALDRPGEAAEAFRAGAVLEPASKLWTPLVRKAETAAKEKPALAPAAAAAVPAASATVTKSATNGTSSSSGGSVTKSASSSKASTTAASTGSSGGDGSEPGHGMKGYKKTADGRVTTYFNNDLTEEAKALIGDIAPKKLEPAEAAATAGGGNDVSAWNKAGTWESRDMTSWAKQRLEELLGAVEFDASESTVKVVKVEKLEGDAEISFSRGKKRYMFDFRFELKWEAPDLDCGPAKGVLMYPDVGQDCDGVYDVECRVDSSTPPAARAFVDRHVRPEASGLRTAVLSSLATFTSELYAK